MCFIVFRIGHLKEREATLQGLYSRLTFNKLNVTLIVHCAGQGSNAFEQESAQRDCLPAFQFDLKDLRAQFGLSCLVVARVSLAFL